MELLDSQLVTFVVAAAGLSWLFVKEKLWPHWLGGMSLLIVFLGAWAVGISIIATYKFNTTLPGRYGLSVGTLLVLALIGGLRGRGPRLAFAAFSVVNLILAFWFMLV